MQLLIMNLKRPIYVTIDWDIRKEFPQPMKVNVILPYEEGYNLQREEV